jgi:hypothetical protein
MMYSILVEDDAIKDFGLVLCHFLKILISGSTHVSCYWLATLAIYLIHSVVALYCWLLPLHDELTMSSQSKRVFVAVLFVDARFRFEAEKVETSRVGVESSESVFWPKG